MENREKNQPFDVDIIPSLPKPTKTTRVVNRFAVLSLLVITVVLGIMLSWSFEAQNPLVIKNSPFPTRSIPPNASADVVVIDVDYCKNTDKQASVRTSYVGSTREIFMPLVKEQYDKGCYTESIPILIPSSLPPDTYKLRFVATYNINPLKQNVQVIFESQEFTIIEDNGLHRSE